MNKVTFNDKKLEEQLKSVQQENARLTNAIWAAAANPLSIALPRTVLKAVRNNDGETAVHVRAFTEACETQLEA